MKQLLGAAALALSLSACSSDPADAPNAAPGGSGSMPTSEVTATQDAPAAQAETPVDASVLTPDGLGGLRIGEAVPAGSSWGARLAQIPGSCRTISSPDFPGAHAIVEDGKVRRITIGERSDLTLAEGIGTGATEAEARAAFPGFREKPHKYVEAPAKYLTAPNAADGGPALRFEIGADRKVSLIHAGTMPVLGYVEGCA